MRQVNLEERVAFEFEGATIWAGSEDNSEESDQVNAYAMHYKSYGETYDQLRRPKNETVNKPQKYFVGKGGIISMTTRKNNQKQSVPVTYKIAFDKNYTVGDYRCLSCEYLDPVTHTWASNGCVVGETDEGGITCKCNHTTNFAAFMSPYDKEYIATDEQEKWLDMMAYIGSFLSACGLTASLVTFIIVRNIVRNDRIKAHINLVVALLVVHMIQIFVDFALHLDEWCMATTILTHYFLLAAFMWMFIEGVFLYIYVVQVFVYQRMSNKWWMYVIGWLVPLIVVAISAGYGIQNDIYMKKREIKDPCEENQVLYPPYQDPMENVTYESCWLNPDTGMTWTFVGPAIAVITFNFIILCKVVQVLVKLSKRKNGMKAFSSGPSSSSNGKGYGTSQYGNGAKAYAAKRTSHTYDSTKDFKQNNRYVPSNRDDQLENENNLHVNGNHNRSINSSTYTIHNDKRKSADDLTSNASSSDTIDEIQILKDVKTAVKGALVLLPLLGIPWICGLLGYKNYYLTLMFVILNSIQGVLIFFVYCVWNGEVQRAMKRKFQIYQTHQHIKDRHRTSSVSSLKTHSFSFSLTRFRRRSTAHSTSASSFRKDLA